MAETVSLYVALRLRLLADAARAASALLRVRGCPSVVLAKDIVFRATIEAGQRVVTARVSLLPVIVSELPVEVFGLPCQAEMEALCSLVEVLHDEVRRAQGVPPLHLFEQADHDAGQLAAHRAVVARHPELVAEVAAEVAQRLKRGGP